MRVIAHRGGLETKYKPNTKECLLEALECSNTDGIELDIRMTKDNKIIIIHDSLINFVSDGRGIVSKMSLKKIKKYNFGTKKIPQKIATLDSFLKDVVGNKIILIEIKDKNEMVVKYLMRVLSKYKLNYYLCSFHYEVINKLRDFYKCGLLIGLGQNVKRLYNDFNFNIVSYFYKDNVSLKKETFLWTLNSKKDDIEKYFIITDYPSRFLNLIP